MRAGTVQRLTAADAERAQRRAAAALAARGLAAGDRVACVVPSSVDLLCLLLGALRSGVVPVPLNPALLPAERDALLGDAEPALVVDDEVVLRSLVEHDGERDLAPVPRARPMHYTSGTTGRPKGVWSGVLGEADAAALSREEAEVWRFAADDVHLVCSPLWHSAPIRFATGTLLAGGDVVLLPTFDAALAAEAIATYRPTTTFVVPAHLQRLLAHGAPDLGGFRLLAHAGAPCPERLKRDVLAACRDGAVWEFYGSTEGQFTVCSPDEWLERPGTVGRARLHRRVSTDAEGTIWCDVPAYARFEYWRDPERTAAAWRGSAFTVGDLGRLDDDGYLFLDGRRDDLVISGGVNVYPVEVEQAIAVVPGVEEVAVFGVADERWGQRVCAAIVGDVDPDAVRATAAARLAPHKRPKDVYVVASLPHTSTGKVVRGAVARQLGLEKG